MQALTGRRPDGGHFTPEHRGQEGGRTAEASNQRSRGWRAPPPAARPHADAVRPCLEVAEVGLEPGQVPAARKAVTIWRPLAPPWSPGPASQPAPRAWSSARGYRASTASRAPSARRRRGRPRASPRSREPLKGGSKGVGLGQARGAVAAAARAWGECTSAGNSTDLWDLMLEDTWTRRKVKPPPG